MSSCGTCGQQKRDTALFRRVPQHTHGGGAENPRLASGYPHPLSGLRPPPASPADRPAACPLYGYVLHRVRFSVADKKNETWGPAQRLVCLLRSALIKATRGGIRYGRMIRSGHWRELVAWSDPLLAA